VNWTVRETGISGSLNAVAFGNNIFVVVGTDHWGPLAILPSRVILTSPDGVNWTVIDSERVPVFVLYDVTYGNNTFVAVGVDGLDLTSTDGLNWRTRSQETGVMGRVTYWNGTFVGVGDYGTIVQSDSAFSQGLSAPAPNVSIDDKRVSLYWNPVGGAEGFTLFFAPYPDASYVESVDLGRNWGLSVDLWPGAAYYIAVQAYDGKRTSAYSEIQYVIVP
jgi:hypothetical protein